MLCVGQRESGAAGAVVFLCVRDGLQADNMTEHYCSFPGAQPTHEAIFHFYRSLKTDVMGHVQHTKQRVKHTIHTPLAVSHNFLNMRSVLANEYSDTVARCAIIPST